MIKIHHAREFYIFISVDNERNNAEIQKVYGNQLRTKKYLVNLSEIYLASPRIMRHDQLNRNDDDDGIPLHMEASEETNEVMFNMIYF